MSLKRILSLTIILLLWVPLVVAQIPDENRRDINNVPPQFVIQSMLVGKLFRYAQCTPDIDPTLRSTINQWAEKTIEHTRTEYPDSSFIVLRCAIIKAFFGDKDGALKIIDNVDYKIMPPLMIVLSDHLKGDSLHGMSNVESLITLNLDGYYVCMAYKVFDLRLPADMQSRNKAASQADVWYLYFLFFTIFTSFSCAFIYLAYRCHKFFSKNSANKESDLDKECSLESQTAQNTPDLKEPIIQWEPLKVLFVFVILQWVSILLGGVLSRVFSDFKIPFEFKLASLQCLLYAVVLFLLTLLLPYLLKSDKSVTPAKALGITKFHLYYIFLGLAGMGFSLPIVGLVSWITSLIIGKMPFSTNLVLNFIMSATPEGWVIIGLLIAFIGPIFEEIMFRGLLFGGIKDTVGFVGSALLSGIMFSAVHGDIYGTLPLAGLGVLFAFLYHISKSLWPAIIAHCMWNGFVLFNMIAVLSNW